MSVDIVECAANEKSLSRGDFPNRLRLIIPEDFHFLNGPYPRLNFFKSWNPFFRKTRGVQTRCSWVVCRAMAHQMCLSHLELQLDGV